MEENPSVDRLLGMHAGEGRAADPLPEVIEACQRGEREAFRELFEIYKDRVYSIARNFAPDETVAQDVTQEIFLRLFSAIRGYRGDSAFRTWLFRLVVNACTDEWRRRRRLVPLEGAPLAEREGPRSIESIVARGEIAVQVRGALAHLSPRLRIPILLRYVEEMSYDEIAEVLRCSPGTVASRLNRGRRDLARRLAHLRGRV